MRSRSATASSTAPSVYGNEPEIGRVFAGAFADRVVERDDLFVMSKLWNDSHGAEGVARSVRRTLADLGLDHLDGYFVHWPFPNHHPPAADPDARDPHARPYLHDEFMETWQAMESLVDQGLVRHLGLSNVTVPKLRLILRRRPGPAVAERDGAAPLLPAARALRPLRRRGRPADRLLPARLALAPGA